MTDLNRSWWWLSFAVPRTEAKPDGLRGVAVWCRGQISSTPSTTLTTSVQTPAAK